MTKSNAIEVYIKCKRFAVRGRLLITMKGLRDLKVDRSSAFSDHIAEENINKYINDTYSWRISPRTRKQYISCLTDGVNRQSSWQTDRVDKTVDRQNGSDRGPTVDQTVDQQSRSDSGPAE